MTAPGQMQSPVNKPKTPPYKLAGLVLLVIAAIVVALVWTQFRGGFADPERLTLISPRSGLSMDTGSKVTYNGVEIGRVTDIQAITVGDQPRAKILLDVRPKYLTFVPANADVGIEASTVFGNKYVALSAPQNPVPQRLSPATVLDATAVTTEFNTLFETVLSVAQQVDPIKLNQTLTATAQALDGLGERFGQSIENGNAILDDVNTRMPELTSDIKSLADFSGTYADAAPDLLDALRHAVTTAHTLNERRGDLDQALMAAVGFGNTGGEVLEKSAPYLVRANADLVPTSALLDEYSPMLFCGIRNTAQVAPAVFEAQAGNGYSLNAASEALGAPNPYVYPDNLPRVNAHGGPEGRPGCWQPITRDLWPAPWLVTDTGYSKAPYNHLELGQPIATEYVWGRQIGENTINP